MPRKTTTPSASLPATAKGGEWPPEGGRGTRRKSGSDPEGGHKRPAALHPDSGRTPSDDGAPAPPLPAAARAAGATLERDAAASDRGRRHLLRWPIPCGAHRPTLRSALLKNRRGKNTSCGKQSTKSPRLIEAGWTRSGRGGGRRKKKTTTFPASLLLLLIRRGETGLPFSFFKQETSVSIFVQNGADQKRADSACVLFIH